MPRRPHLLRARVVPLAAALLVVAAVPLPAAVGAPGDPPVVQVHSSGPAEPEVVVEPVPDVPDAVRRQGRSAARDSAAAATDGAGVPDLHSRPGSARTLLLDFDGETVSGSRWSSNQGLPDPYVALPWSMDADPAVSTVEAARIREVWAVVAEDFAAFDVDVTTVDPGTDGLARTSLLVRTFGVRALMSDSDAWRQVCQGSRCGGVAYVDVFDDVGASAFQPAWVFPQNFADDAKIMGDAISHEVGHTLGLAHDGTLSPQREYYSGQGVWSPIMGASGAQPLTQWSNGDYTSASNRQDDVAMIAAGGVPLVADDAGDTAADARSGLPAAGVIGTRTDTDWYRLSGCTGAVQVSASPASLAAGVPDLDLSLELRDPAGTLIDSDDPAAVRTSSGSRTLTGLGARVDADAVRSDYLVRVDGVGSGSPLTGGYSDYGSTGRYTLALSGTCQAASTGLASLPRAVLTAVLGTAVTVTWSPPESTGGSPITGYRVTAQPGGQVLTTGADGRSVTFTGLARATAYTFSVVATNDAGNSPTTQVDASTPASAPSAVSRIALSADAARLVLTWGPPEDDGGSPVTGYRVRVGTLDQTYAADVGMLTVTGLSGAVTAWVSPVNAAGEGTPSSLSTTLPGGPAAGTATPEPPGGSGAPGVLAPVVRPSVAGTARVGRVLRARPGTWTRPASLRYRWMVGTRVVGRSASYRPTRTLAGRRLVLQVTATAVGAAPVTVRLRTAPVRR